MLMHNPGNAFVARAMGLAIILVANLFLVQVNSSDTDSILKSIKHLALDKVMWTVNILVVAGLLVMLYSPLHLFLKLAPLTALQLLAVVVLGAGSVLWYEIVKLIGRMHRRP
jgi:Ca2+-transporting ATPase